MSGTALVPMSDIQAMAQAFAKSGLFGTKTPDQCMALLLLAQAENCHPAIAMRDFDIIQGKPAKKSEAMLRSFITADGVIEWHEMSDTKADASFTHPKGSNGKPVRISWDLDRAKKAGLLGKDNWTKYGRQMLANRVISEGCRRVYPAATSGMYEPGEVRAMARDDKRKEKDMGAAEIVPHESAAPQELPPSNVASATTPADAADPSTISLDEAMTLAADLRACDPQAEATFLKVAKIAKLTELQALDMPEAQEWVKRRKEKVARK